MERIISNACHAVGDCYACKTAAIIERRISNACHALTDCNACKTTAIIERIVLDIFDTFRNDEIFY